MTYWTFYSFKPLESCVSLPSHNVHTIYLYFCHFRLLQESNQWFDHWKPFYTDCQSQYSGWCFCFDLFSEKFFFLQSSGSGCILEHKWHLKAFDMKLESAANIFIGPCFSLTEKECLIVSHTILDSLYASKNQIKMQVSTCISHAWVWKTSRSLRFWGCKCVVYRRNDWFSDQFPGKVVIICKV